MLSPKDRFANAVENGDAKKILHIGEKYADVDFSDNVRVFGRTPWMIAAYKGSLVPETVSLMKRFGCSPDVADLTGRTVGDYALLGRRYDSFVAWAEVASEHSVLRVLSSLTEMELVAAVAKLLSSTEKLPDTLLKSASALAWKNRRAFAGMLEHVDYVGFIPVIDAVRFLNLAKQVLENKTEFEKTVRHVFEQWYGYSVREIVNNPPLECRGEWLEFSDALSGFCAAFAEIDVILDSSAEREEPSFL